MREGVETSYYGFTPESFTTFAQRGISFFGSPAKFSGVLATTNSREDAETDRLKIPFPRCRSRRPVGSLRVRKTPTGVVAKSQKHLSAVSL